MKQLKEKPLTYKNRIPLIFIYNRTLLDVTSAITKNSNILHIFNSNSDNVNGGNVSQRKQKDKIILIRYKQENVKSKGKSMGKARKRSIVC